MTKVKVRITDEVSGFSYEGKTYKPGDILVLPENQFVPYFMELIEEPTPVKEPAKKPPKEEAVEEANEAPTEEPTVVPNIAPALAAPKVKKKGRKKSTS